MDYNYIFEVYKAGSFTEAAKRLYLTQPALSTAVKKAEEALGFTVFDRSTKPMKLTVEGQVYVDTQVRIQQLENEMFTKIADISELKSGKVTVSGENFVTSFILPDILQAFSRLYPGIEVSLVESNAPDLRALLLSEETDVLIAHEIDEQLYGKRRLTEENLMLCVPNGFAVNQKLKSYALSADDIVSDKHLSDGVKRLSITAFADQPFLILKPGNDMYRRATHVFEQKEIVPNVVLTLDQLITSYNMAQSGLGCAFVTDAVVKHAHGNGCTYYLLEEKPYTRSFNIGWKKQRYLPKAVTAFIETAVQVYEKKQ